ETRTGQTLGGRFHLGHVLVAGQVAMSLVMLMAAGLFVGTLQKLRSIDVGFEPEGVLLFRLNARQAGRPAADVAGFYDLLRKQFQAIPGVRDVTLSNQPLSFAGYGLGDTIPGKVSNPEDRVLMIGPWFFKTMRIPILAGREIDDRDTPGSQPVA